MRATRAASALADVLARIGLGGLTRRARLALARASGDALEVEVRGARITGTYTSHYQYLLELPRGGPHPYQLELFVDHVEPGMTVLDVGAHIGVYATLAAIAVGPAGRVIAVEPDPRNGALLRRNAAANGVADRVELIEAVAGEESGTVSFFRDEAEATGTMGSRWRDPLAASERVELPAVRLDEALGGRSADLLKLDVQGAEMAALRGMRETLEREPPRVVFAELNEAALERAGASGAELVEALRAIGLRVMFVDEAERRLVPLDGAPDGTERTENLVCVRA